MYTWYLSLSGPDKTQMCLASPWWLYHAPLRNIHLRVSEPRMHATKAVGLQIGPDAINGSGQLRDRSEVSEE